MKNTVTQKDIDANPQKSELTKEDLTIIVNALSVAQVQVKDAPRIIELINKCSAMAR